MTDEILRVIEKNQLFAGLSGELIRDIAASATRKTLGANETLFRKGDRANEIWGVLSGRVVFQVATSDGKELVLGTFNAGDMFGEVGVLDFGPRSVDARSETRSELFRLNRSQFLNHLHASPELCFRVFSLLCKDLRETTEALECTALYALSSRLAKKLVDLAGKESQELQSAPRVVGISHNELARLLGVHRVSVSRQMSQWEKDGLLSSGRQRIEIRNLQKLVQLSAPIHNGEFGHENWSAIHFGDPPVQESPGTDLPVKGDPMAASEFRGILAVDAAEYSQSLNTDAAGTLKRLKAGMRAINRAIDECQGRLIFHSGDRILADFDNASEAFKAALAIHERVHGLGTFGTGHTHSIFRIGVHFGEVLDARHGYFGEAANVAICLANISGAGGICISGPVRAKLVEVEDRNLQFLGNHELRNVSGAVAVYAARPVSLPRKLLLRLASFIPRRIRIATARWALLVALIAIGLAGAWINSVTNPDPSLASRSIAVLPFEVVGDPDHSYLSNGLVTKIRAGLQGLPDILVIGSTSADYFTGRAASMSEISEALQADWLLLGSVGKTGDELMASARLLNAANGTEAWNHEFKGNWTDYYSFSADVVGLTGESLSGGARGDSDVVLPSMTDNDEARALYLRAEELEAHGMCASVSVAVPLLERSVDLDPQFAEAWAKLAGHYGANCPLSKDYPDNRRTLAESALSRAMLLAPESPVVLTTAASRSVVVGDLDAGRQIIEKVLALNANDVDALFQLALIYLEQDNWVAAFDIFERLLYLDPLNFRVLSYRSYNLTVSEQWQELLLLAQKTLDYYPDNPVPYYWMANAHLHLGDRVKAIDMQRRAMPFGPPIDLWTGLDYRWDTPIRHEVRFANPRAYVGDFDVARRLIEDEYTRADDDASPGNSVGYLINMGEIESLAGNFDASITYFEQAIAMLPGKEYGLEYANRGPWISDARQTYVLLALLNAYRRSGKNVQASLIADVFRKNLEQGRQLRRSVGVKAEHLLSYPEAQFHAIEGRIPEALSSLRHWRENSEAIFTYVKSDPFLENLHGEAEFQVIVAEIESELADIRAQYFSSHPVEALADQL